MLSPTVSNRVRVIGHYDEFMIVRVDYVASVVDLCTLAGETALERNVPFSQLYASAEVDDADFPDDPHDRRIADTGNMLRTSQLQLHQSHAAIADLMTTITATVDVIRNSRALIATTDHMIPWPGPAVSMDEEPEYTDS